MLLLAGAIAMAGPGDAAPSPKAARPLPPALHPSYYGMEEAERDDALMRDTLLTMHNEEREALGLPPLAWDSGLAAEAAEYAREMAATNQFRHSQRTSRSVPSGENLWMGSRRLYGYAVMAESFLEERRYFRRDGVLPDISTTGRWEDVGHYSQIIWRATRKLGCAVAENRSYDYLVCRYFPAGNVYGQNPLDRDESAPAHYADGRR